MSPKQRYATNSWSQWSSLTASILLSFTVYFYGVRSKPRNSVSRDRRKPRTACIQILNLISRRVSRTTLIALCFVLSGDLHINILKFVAGHGAVVQPASITIVIACKRAQQYSRKHQLGFISASVGVHKTVDRIGRTCRSLLHYNTSTFMHFMRSVGCARVWSRKSHHPTPTPGNFDSPTPTPDRLRPSAVLVT